MYTHKFNVFVNIVYPIQKNHIRSHKGDFDKFLFSLIILSHFILFLYLFTLLCFSVSMNILLKLYTNFRNGGLVGGFSIPSDGYFFKGRQFFRTVLLKQISFE